MKIEEWRHKILEKMNKILNGYICHNIVKDYTEFKHNIITHYESKLRKRSLQCSENWAELKELKDRNKKLRIEAYRRNFMHSNHHKVNKNKKRLKSARKSTRSNFIA